jgi:UDP-4-amino-4,6-dideoxy-N-acetyl-beta-L-altrosamine N-acetyltransferase
MTVIIGSNEVVDHKIIINGFGGIELCNYVNLNSEEKNLVLRMRNHSEIKKWMYNQNNISEIEHSVFFANLKNDVNKKYYLVKNNKKILGSVNFSKIHLNNSAELGLYVNPFLRREGIGRVLDTVSSYYAFKELGVNKLKLEVFSNNERAISFYKKCGFELIKTVAAERYKIIYMEKKISNEQIDKY